MEALSKGSIGVVDSFTNTGTGIFQGTDLKHPNIQLFNSNGSPFQYRLTDKPAYRVYPIIIFNQSGPFFIKFDRTGKVGGYDSGYGRSDMLQMLHDLAHIVFDANGIPLIINDGPGTGVDPESNSVIVKQACQKEIEAAYNK